MNTYTEDDLRAALAHEADAGLTTVDVWPHLHRRIVVRRRVRAGVAAAAVGVIAAVVVVALPTHQDAVTVPPAGSSTTTLVPDVPLSDSALATAVDILRHRLDALRVTGAELSTHDGAIEVNAPSLSNGEIAAVAVRGVLQLRPVEEVNAGSSCASADSTHYACSSDGTHYRVGPVALDNADVRSADVVANTIDSSWLTLFTFTHVGAQKFYELTADLVKKPGITTDCRPPQGCNAIAVIVDGTVLQTPSVQGAGGIRGGQTQVSGLTRQQARDLAAIVANPPLPTAFSVG